ncbi:MAG: hypothetical protein VX589_17350 [Myxococcota bacterium]|nr:hypothetical protein [Myxococcota bacterium]
MHPLTAICVDGQRSACTPTSRCPWRRAASTNIRVSTATRTHRCCVGDGYVQRHASDFGLAFTFLWPGSVLTLMSFLNPLDKFRRN